MYECTMLEVRCTMWESNLPFIMYELRFTTFPAGQAGKAVACHVRLGVLAFQQVPVQGCQQGRVERPSEKTPQRAVGFEQRKARFDLPDDL